MYLVAFFVSSLRIISLTHGEFKTYKGQVLYLYSFILSNFYRLNFCRYKVYNVLTRNPQETEILQLLSAENGYDFWAFKDDLSTISVAPDQQVEFAKIVKENNLLSNVSISFKTKVHYLSK